MKKSATVKAAWISATAVVTAALIAGIFSLLGRDHIPESPQDIRSSKPPVSYRLDLWEFSYTISLAALGRAEGAPDGLVQNQFQKAQIIAHDLGIILPELPSLVDNPARNRAAAIYYLREDIGNILTVRIQRSYSETEAALVEFAIKSMLLARFYVPGEKEDLLNLYAETESAAVRCGLPTHFYAQLLDGIREELPYETVKQRMVRMHENIKSYLRLNKPLQPTR